MFKDYAAKAITAKVMTEATISDGKQAYSIMNFDVDQQGFLNFNFRVMPLIPDEWNPSAVGDAQPTALSGLIGFAQGSFDGGVRPEILFLTTSGVFRYTPWLRSSGSSGNRGIEEQFTYSNRPNWDASSVKPQEEQRFPPQSLQLGDRIYFNFGDGGSIWVWNGVKLRSFGYTTSPSSPSCFGPSGTTDNAVTSTGFSVQGRIGTLTSNQLLDGTTPVGSHGVKPGEWKYSVIFENEDGAYSQSSPLSNSVTLNAATTSDTQSSEVYRRAFWIKDIPLGPLGTIARVLIRTPDIRNTTISGGDHRPRFLHRIPNNFSDEWLDSTPDGDLGHPWDDRSAAPVGTYLIQSFAGSLFVMRTNSLPYRVWWSEQTSLFGSTPESFMRNHYIDVDPSSGGITGSHPSASSSGDTTSPALLVFKESATCFITGSYPDFKTGTLHNQAGLAGPSLVQSAPDGTVVWFGNGTFWGFIPEKGKIIDIGKPIKKRLSRVNVTSARKGVSWVDPNAGELVFVLPMDDSTVPNMQFVWDHRFTGWRIKEDFSIKAAMPIKNSDIVLIGGKYAPVGGDTKYHGVYAYGNSYTGYPVKSPTATFRSGWTSMGEVGPTMHTLSNVNDLIVILRESFSGTATVSSYQDWDGDNSIESGTISTSHPENDNIPYYDAAQYDTDVYRELRTYSDRTALSIASASVFQVKIESSDPISLLTLDVYGPMVAYPGGRTPQ